MNTLIPLPPPLESFQNERSFQKQTNVFLNRKKIVTGRKKDLRYHRDVGLGFKTPREVITIWLNFINQEFLPNLQNERAFQKQGNVNLNRKVIKSKSQLRYHKDVGLGFKTPREVFK